jgi:hypothetical protein
VEPTAWAVDDTGFPKDGERSVGVQPFQYGEAFRVFRFDLPWEPPRADSEAPLREA